MATLQSKQVSGSFLVCLCGAGTQTAAGTDAARWYAPAAGNSKGVVVRGIKLFVGEETGTAGLTTLEVNNQTTSMLSAAVTTSAVGSSSATMAFDGREIVTSGRYIRFDWTAAATQNATTGLSNIYVQVDYDWL